MTTRKLANRNTWTDRHLSSQTVKNNGKRKVWCTFKATEIRLSDGLELGSTHWYGFLWHTHRERTLVMLVGDRWIAVPSIVLYSDVVRLAMVD